MAPPSTGIPSSHATTHPSRWCSKSIRPSWTIYAITNKPSLDGLSTMRPSAVANVGQILQGSPQSIRSPLVLAGSLLHDLLPADLAVIAEGSLLNKVFPSKKDYLLHTVEDRSPTLNQAKWPSFHAHSRHLRTEPGPMDTTHPSCHLSHHQVIHHCLPTIV